MNQDEIDKLATRLSTAFPLAGGWRQRQAAHQLADTDSPSAVRVHLRQSYGALRPVDQAWIELITALVLLRRHDVELLDAPNTAAAGECDVELDG